jgi:hypothetical protein
MLTYLHCTEHADSNTKAQIKLANLRNTNRKQKDTCFIKAQLSQYKTIIKAYVMSKSNNPFLPSSTIVWHLRNYSNN